MFQRPFSVSVTLVKVVVMTDAAEARAFIRRRMWHVILWPKYCFAVGCLLRPPYAKHCKCILLCSSTNDGLQVTNEPLIISLLHLNEDVLAAAAP
jgi:hypothetical protein